MKAFETRDVLEHPMNGISLLLARVPSADNMGAWLKPPELDVVEMALMEPAVGICDGKLKIPGTVVVEYQHSATLDKVDQFLDNVYRGTPEERRPNLRQ